jgi:hypothetical protein
MPVVTDQPQSICVLTKHFHFKVALHLASPYELASSSEFIFQ